MSAYRFTAGTADERRRWVSAVAFGMRMEAASKYEVGANLERAAELLERCDAEAGVIPLDALGTALTECVALEDIGRILGVQGPDVDLVAELRRAGGDGSMETRDFSTPAVLTVYFGVVAHGKDVYRESLDLLEYLMQPARAMSLHELFRKRAHHGASLDAVSAAARYSAVVRTGATDPRALKALRKKGVKIYSVENLHAKVLIYDDAMIVGSANASASSSSGLIEACLIVSEPGAIAEARAWAAGLQAEEISPQQLDRLIKAYRPPKQPPAAGAKGAPAHAPLWITWSVESDFDPLLLKRVDAQTAALNDRVTKRYELDVIEFTGRAPKLVPNDQLIIFEHVGDSVTVYGKTRVLDVKRWSNGRGKQRCYVWFEFDGSATMGPKRFIAHTKTLGMKRVTVRSTRQVRNATIAHALRRLWIDA